MELGWRGHGATILRDAKKALIFIRRTRGSTRRGEARGSNCLLASCCAGHKRTRPENDYGGKKVNAEGNNRQTANAAHQSF